MFYRSVKFHLNRSWTICSCLSVSRRLRRSHFRFLSIAPSSNTFIKCNDKCCRHSCACRERGLRETRIAFSNNFSCGRFYRLFWHPWNRKFGRRGGYVRKRRERKTGSHADRMSLILPFPCTACSSFRRRRFIVSLFRVNESERIFDWLAPVSLITIALVSIRHYERLSWKWLLKFFSYRASETRFTIFIIIYLLRISQYQSWTYFYLNME